MVDTAHQRLQDAARDVWADPVASAQTAAVAILQMLEEDWTEREATAVFELRRRRADSPFILAITRTVLEVEPGTREEALRSILDRLTDRTWADETGLRIAHHATLGVMSLGDTTLAVLEAASGLGGSSAVLFTDRRAIAKGLTYLGLTVEVAPPEQAGAVLLPAVAIIGSRLWTTARAADVAIRSSLLDGEVVVVAHPLASLSPENRADFRPASALVDVKI